MIAEKAESCDPIEHQAAIEVVLGENGAIGWVSSSEDLLVIA